MAKHILFVALGIVAILFGTVWLADLRRRRALARGGGATIAPGLAETGVGFVTNFFDTLGIGSFATTTSLYKLREMIDDRLIPGTLNVGHSVPVIVQAFIYIAIIEVDIRTLALLIAAAIAGAWFGAGIVSSWSRRRVRLGMGACLLGAASLMLMTQFALAPGSGEALALGGARLGLGIAGNVVLGALMTLGIGLYAPCMIMVSLLGMSPSTAFPIMMGSCAFLMPVGSVRFVRASSYGVRQALGLTLGGIPAVLVAAYLVKSLPLGAVRWLVIAVVVYTALGMLRSARADAAPTAAPERRLVEG